MKVAMKWCVTGILLLVTASFALAGGRAPVKPSQKDKCPVCGMFVAKYPDFAAQIVFKDGSRAHFDGVKDMFKYYLDMKRYNPGKKVSDIDAVYVTDYYRLHLTDGLTALYVYGSNVMGPMGKELVAFGNKGDAEEFMKDHRGKNIVRFKEVARDLIKELD